MNHRPNFDRRGFTLLEILLAVTILGILLTTVYGAVSRTINSKQIAEEHAELFATGREAVLKMASELEAAVSPRSGDRIIFRGTKSSGNPPTDTVEFVMTNRGNYGYNSVRPGQVLVVYTLDPLAQARGYYALRREEYLYSKLLADADGIETQTTSSMTEEEDSRPTEAATYLIDCPDLPGQLEIAGNCLMVGGLELSYYDDFARDWRDEWDSTSQAMLGRLPSAVRIALYMADERGILHDFSTIVDLPIARGQPTPKPGETLEDMVNEASGDGDSANDPGLAGGGGGPGGNGTGGANTFGPNRGGGSGSGSGGGGGSGGGKRGNGSSFGRGLADRLFRNQ